MAGCKQRINLSKRVICAGDMRDKIELFKRDIASPLAESEENEQVYTSIAVVPAAIRTTNGIDIFDGIEKSGADGIPRVATVIFYIRSRPDLTAENFVLYKGTNFEVLGVDDFDLRREFMGLFSAPRGDFNLKAAK